MMRKDRFQDLLVRARRDERGTIAIIFSFSVFALCGIIGLAIDASRAYSVAARTQSILDTASLAAAKMLDVAGATDDEVKKSATDFYSANLSGQKDLTAVFENLQVTPQRGSKTVIVSVDVVIPTVFAGVVGFKEFRFKRDSFVIYETKSIELALVLDTTGSMCDELMPYGVPCTKTSKIDALKDAAKDVIDKVLDRSGSSVNNNRVALAPFAAAVNVGSYRTQVASGQSPALDNCVVERPGSAAITDEPISGGTRARVVNVMPWSPTNTGTNYSCPAGVIRPLSDDVSMLKSQIDSYVPYGGTAGHLGLAWGWNLISPNFGSVFTGSSTPAQYSDRTVVKSIVLMTDGYFNTAYKSGDASSDTVQANESNGDFAELCKAMKLKGVHVYTIGFGLSAVAEPERATAKKVLRECATEPSNFFDADDIAELKAAFSSIAGYLLALRVSS